MTVPFDKDQVKDAPRVDLDGGPPRPSEEQRLFRYYGLTEPAARPARGADDETATDTTGTTAPRHGHRTARHRRARRPRRGHDTSGPTTDDAMTRSEEHLEVGTPSARPAGPGCASTSPPRRDGHRAGRQGARRPRARADHRRRTSATRPRRAAISEEEHEVVLHEEDRGRQDRRARRARPPRHRDRDEEETVTEDVRKEQIEVEGDVERR